MKSKTRFKSNTRGIVCQNCQQPLSSQDNFCSNCGQVNDLKPLSIKQFLKELLSGFFAFDTRTFNTLKPLLFNPGKVTKDYIEGKRVKYVNPFQLYLHVSIIFFLLMGFFASLDRYSGNSFIKDNVTFENNKDSIREKKIGIINFSFNNKKKELKQLRDTTINYILTNSINLLNDGTDFLKTTKATEKQRLINEYVFVSYNVLSSYKVPDSLRDEYTIRQLFLKKLDKNLKERDISYDLSPMIAMSPTEARDNRIALESFSEKVNRFYEAKTRNTIKALDSMAYPKTKTNIFWFEKTKYIKDFTESKQNFDGFITNLLSKISLLMFFGLPIFTLFVSMLYYRNKKTYTEHLIFVFHIQTVVFLWLIFFTIFDRIFDTDIGLLLVAIIFSHYSYRAMKFFYEQSTWKTILKYLLLNFIAFMLVIIGFSAASTLALLF